ncbi:MAG TPA: AAA family ATPase [Thermoplasmata archaeon]|nr:AAA family ATPase [Thermoplasmata archaeon]
MSGSREETPRDGRPLSERLRPHRLAEIAGNPRALAKLLQWGREWSTGTAPPRQRAAVLAGPPGVGKTTAALALAAEFGWTVVEMNASDSRNQTAIDLVAGRAAITHTLGDTGKFRQPKDGGRTLILLDEADSLTGRATESAAPKPSPLAFRDFLRGRYGTTDALNRGWKLGETGRPAAFGAWSDVPTTAGRGAFTKLAEAQRDIGDWRGSSKTVDTSDRGGLGAIARLVRETRQPLVLTVNDERTLRRYSPVFASGVLRLTFERLGDREMLAFLRGLVTSQNLRVTPKALDAIVRRSRGDLRGATNDLEAIAPLEPGPQQESVLGARDVGGEIGELVEETLAAPRFYRSVEIRNRVDVTPDDLLPWFEENATRFARSEFGRSAGIDAIARAERHLARARRYRVYGLWSFASELMTGGTAVALEAAGGVRIASAFFPAFLGEMGRSRAARALRQSTLDKAGRHLHLSRRKGAESTLPFLEAAFAVPGIRDGPVFEFRRAIVHDLELTPEEVGFLARVEPEAEGIRALFPTEDDTPEVTPEPESDAPVAVAPTPEPRKRVQRSLGEF